MARKVDDGRSVRAAVGASTTIVKDNFYILGGFLGMATYAIITDAEGAVTSYKGQAVGAGGLASAPAEMVLNIESGTYETTQIDGEQTYVTGTKLYYDDVEKEFTNNAAAGVNRFAGIIVYADNTNNIIWFVFVPAGAGADGADGEDGEDGTTPQIADPGDITAGNAQGEYASLATGVVGDNNAITWTAQKVGEDGNDITVAIVAPTEASQSLAVAVDGTDITVNLATDAGTAASGTTGIEGSNNGLTWTAQAVGEDGNEIMVALEDPDGNDQVLAVTVNGTSILVKLATGGAGAISTTAAQVIAAIEANADAAALVAVANTGASTGAAAVTDEIVELASGADPAASSTASQVMAAVIAEPTAAALVSVANTSTSNGSGTVAAAAEASLTGGIESEGQQAVAKLNALFVAMRAAGFLV